MDVDISAEILRLKRELGAVILAHYYTLPEVQALADFVGDSLALSETAARTDAGVILFAGVHFMAETAKILSPEKTVLVADAEAGCSLAASCPAADFAEFVAARPGHKVITYVNTTAGVKALTDVCCTSSNAVRVVESFDPGQPLIFAPDRNLGAYIKRITGRRNIVLWDGACHVHEKFSAPALRRLKDENPGVPVLAHPECPAEVLDLADFTGSTAAMIEYAGKHPATEFIVVTEPGIMYELESRHPGKRFIAADPCNCCEYMKMITPEKLYEALRTMTPRVEVPEPERIKAKTAIDRMLAVK